MNRFRQHIPSFAYDGDLSEWIEFKNTEDLLSIEVVKRWVKPMDGKPFSHFAISDNHLMAIHDDGFHWWCVGCIEDPVSVDLPKWDGGKIRAEMPDGTIKTLTDEVVSICGDILTLRDGTKVKRRVA